MSQILKVAEYLVKAVLHPMFDGERVQFPTTGRKARLPEKFRSTLAVLHASIPNELVPIARIEGEKIILPAGFLCERWCSSFRLASVYHNLKGAFDEFESELPDSDTEFIWARGVPEPTTENHPVVASVNKMFVPVVAATLLHEVGHSLYRRESENQKETELKCDRFAMEYLLGGESPAGQEFRFVGVAIWLCCVCSESLSQRKLALVSHPHPVDRVMPFITDFLHPHYVIFPGLMGALEGLCMVHIYNLARLRRPEAFEYAMDAFRKTDSGDPLVMLECLKPCWTE
jgi:hypothetical protein